MGSVTRMHVPSGEVCATSSVPSRAVEKKFDFSSTVVKFSARSGRLAMVP